MNQPQIKRDAPGILPLEAKAKLLSEILENRISLDGHMKAYEQARNNEEKANILDVLGSEKEIEKANTTIINSLTIILEETSEQELDQMLADRYLSENVWSELVKAKRLAQVEHLQSEKRNHIDGLEK